MVCASSLLSPQVVQEPRHAETVLEFLARAGLTFDEIDTDGDGRISKDEYDAALARVRDKAGAAGKAPSAAANPASRL